MVALEKLTGDKLSPMNAAHATSTQLRVGELAELIHERWRREENAEGFLRELCRIVDKPRSIIVPLLSVHADEITWLEQLTP